MRPSIHSVLAFFFPLIPFVLADVSFTFPTAGKALTGGTSFTVTWIDSGTAPSLSDLTAYTLFLYTGANTTPVQLLNLATGAYTTGNSVAVTVPTTIGGGTTNAYFLGMISTATAGGTVTNFSPRFTLSGMTGTFAADVVTALATTSGTEGPADINAVVEVAATTSSAAADYGVPYNEQVGTIRYAPMQPIPGTKITATNTAPIYPTSSVSFASTYLAPPTIVTTLTQAQTASGVSSHANTAAAASQPADDMQKYLNRWKD